MTRKFALCLAVACGVLALDAISKVAIVATLHPRQRVVWLGGLLTLQLYRNPGAAFGVGASYTIIIAAIAVGTIVFILRAARRLRSTGWAVSLGLLLGGAAGNLSDRLLRAPGFLRGDVIDWIKLPLFPPTFNLADTSITFGAILAVLLALRGIRIDGGRTGDGTDGESESGSDGGSDAASGRASGTAPDTAPDRAFDSTSDRVSNEESGGTPDGGVTGGAGISGPGQIDSAKIPHHAGAGGPGMGEADTERPPPGDHPADGQPADGQPLDGQAPCDRRRQAS